MQEMAEYSTTQLPSCSSADTLVRINSTQPRIVHDDSSSYENPRISEILTLERSKRRSGVRLSIIHSVGSLITTETTSDSPEVDLAVGVRLQVVKAFKAEDLDELECIVGEFIELDVMPSDEFWMKGTALSPGTLKGAKGYPTSCNSRFFPRDCVQIYDPVRIASTDPDNLISTHDTNTDTVQHNEELLIGMVVVAVYEYSPSQPDELQLKVGDEIAVLELPNGGWCKGLTEFNSLSPKKGWFPVNLVKIHPSTEKEVRITGDTPPVKRASITKKIEKDPFKTQSASARRRASTSSNSSKAKKTKSLDPVTSPIEQNNRNKSASIESSLNSRKSAWFGIKPINTSRVENEPEIQTQKKHHRSVSDISSAISTDFRKSQETLTLCASPPAVMASQQWKGMFTPEQLAASTPIEKKRYAVIWELILTENYYVRDLRLICDEFIGPISSAKLIPPKQIINLFANIEQILAFHVEFSDCLDGIEDIRDTGKYSDLMNSLVIFTLKLRVRS